MTPFHFVSVLCDQSELFREQSDIDDFPAQLMFLGTLTTYLPAPLRTMTTQTLSPIEEETMPSKREREGKDEELAEEDLGPIVGPVPPKQKKKKKLDFEQVYLNALPSAEMSIFYL